MFDFFETIINAVTTIFNLIATVLSSLVEGIIMLTSGLASLVPIAGMAPSIVTVAFGIFCTVAVVRIALDVI